MSKLLDFRKLKNGWHYGEGGPIDKRVFDVALKFYMDLLGLGFTRTDAFPGIDGDVTLVVYHNRHCIELDINLKGKISIVHEKDDVEILSTGFIEYEKAMMSIREIARELWSIYGSSTQTITIRIAKDSKAALSRQQVMARFQLSTSNVSKILAA